MKTKTMIGLWCQVIDSWFENTKWIFENGRRLRKHDLWSNWLWCLHYHLSQAKPSRTVQKRWGSKRHQSYGWISMKIRHFRTVTNKGVHKHGILHVWRWNAFPWRPPWCRRHCSLQKPGKLSTKIRFPKDYEMCDLSHINWRGLIHIFFGFCFSAFRMRLLN